MTALIAARAIVDLADNDGHTPLLVAVQKGTTRSNRRCSPRSKTTPRASTPRPSCRPRTASTSRRSSPRRASTSRRRTARRRARTPTSAAGTSASASAATRTSATTASREEAAKVAAELEDSSIDASARGEQLRARGVKIAFLLAFTEALECWDWPTWRVVRDIVKPATEARGRRRFAELDEVAPHTGPATVFMSHCWGAEWGGLVMAASAGARHDRVVWIDVFAVRARAERSRRGGRARRRRRVDPRSLSPFRAQVRQWPGNGADLDFRGVIRGCTALLVAAPVVEEKISEEFLDNSKKLAVSRERRGRRREEGALRVPPVVRRRAARGAALW